MTDERPPEERATSPDEPDDLQYVVHHANLPETAFSKAVDGVIRRIGDFVSWFWVALMAVICVNVFMKNFLSQGSVQMEEIQWHIYSALFLIGLSYTMIYDDHVRVDLFYERMNLRTKAWIEMLGIALFLIPFILLMLWFAFPFVVQAFEIGERSSAPAGLSHFWIIKSTLLIGFGLLLATSLSRLHRCIALLFLGAEPPKSEG